MNRLLHSMSSHLQTTAGTIAAPYSAAVSALRFCLTPKNWPELAVRLARNPDFFVDLLAYARSDSSNRQAVLLRLVAHLRRRAMEGDATEWQDSTKGFAKTLLENAPQLVQQLRSTPHFGAAQAPNTATTRLDYTILINHELLAFKQEFAGYGFGADAGPLPSGTKISNLALMQCWSLLSNVGHLFGTFATERALLYELFREPRLFDTFLAGIHPDLQTCVEPIAREGRITDFYYALAAWRISRATIDDVTRADCIALWGRFLRERQSSTATMWAFRAARRLAYNRLHLYAGIGPPVDATEHNDSIRALSPWKELVYEPLLVEESSLLEPLLSAADRYQWDSYFAGPNVAAQVLAHIRSFRRWWKGRQDITASIDSLFGRQPTDWPPIETHSMSQFARVKLPQSPKEWKEEVRDWLQEENAWTAGNFLVSPQAKEGLLVDIYVQTGRVPSCALLRAVANRLSIHSVASWKGTATPARRELWRSIAVFGLRTLGLLTKSKVAPVLVPAALSNEASGVTDGRVGYAVLAPPGPALEHARTLADRVAVPLRRLELQTTLLVAEETATLHPGASMLILLGMTLLVDTFEAQIQRAEFDGVWAFFGDEAVTWYFLEHKQQASPTGDLRAKFRHLNGDAITYSVARDDLRGNVSVASIAFTSSSSVAAATAS